MPVPASSVTRVRLFIMSGGIADPRPSAPGNHYKLSRSVSSMGVLSPLMPPPSSPSSAALDPSCLADEELQFREPLADCNLPELLVRDLESSEALFASKAMTAGCPSSASLAAPAVDGKHAVQESALPPAPISRHQVPKDPPRSKLLGIDEVNADAPDDDAAQLELNGELSDSSSVASAMEPHSIRTRGQSIVTAATSVSGRGSSLSLRKPLSQSSPIPSLPSSKMGRGGQSTWYDAETTPQEDEPVAGIHERNSISSPPETALDLSHSDVLDSSSELATDIARTTAPLRVPVGFSRHNSRSHASFGQVLQEKPRIIDIPPLAADPERWPSLTSARYVAQSASLPSIPRRTTSVTGHMVRDRTGGYGGSSQAPSARGGRLLATSTGRTVNGMSEPLPTASTEDRSVRHLRAPSPRSMSTDNGLPSAESDAESRTQHLASSRSLIDAGAETPVSASHPEPFPAGASTPGIPLPPEVIESLRVSISCFPETMLLSSSLSIETIRTYSKKLRHRTDLDSHLRGDDILRPVPAPITSNAGNAKPPKRWNLAWPIHSQRSRYNDYRQQHYPHLLRSPPPSSTSSANLLPPGGAPVTASWAPIKNIFPAASDYLCDALYAHLVAYNYITTLCPPPPPPPPTAPTAAPSRPASRHLRRHHHRNLSVDGDPNPNHDIRIPQKAVSVLGMEDPVAAGTSHHQHHDPRRRPGRRGMLLSRRSSRYLDGGSSPAVGVGRSGSRRGGGGGGADHAPSSSSSSSSSSSPNSMRDIRAGLERCVALLVATLRREAAAGAGAGACVPSGERRGESELGSGSGSSLLAPERERERQREGGGGGVDAVLMRALCEVVRCAEDAVTAAV